MLEIIRKIAADSRRRLDEAEEIHRANQVANAWVRMKMSKIQDDLAETEIKAINTATRLKIAEADLIRAGLPKNKEA